MPMKNDELIEQLSNLKLQEKALKRALDRVYNDVEMRTQLFNKIKKLKKEIDLIKFKIRLVKEMKKNENNNTSKS